MDNPQIGRVLSVVGVGAVGIGLVVLAVPGVADRVGGAEYLVPLLGVFALVQAVRRAREFWNVPRSHAELPDVHRIEPTTVVGETFDRAIERSSRRGLGGRRNRDRLTRHVRRAAVETLVAQTGTDPLTARTRLDEGTWTDDLAAAALFIEDTTPTSGDRVRSVLGRETTFQRRIRRVVVALERLGDEPTDGG